MNRTIFRFVKFTLILICLGFFHATLATPPIFAGENVTYTGAEALKTANIPNTGADKSPGSVFAGVTNSPLASGNTIIINYSSGTDPYRVFGGMSNSEKVMDNIVYYQNGSNVDTIYGGLEVSMDGKDAENNTISISGGTIAGYAIAGYSTYGNSKHNRALMTGGSVAIGLYGSLSYGSKDVSDNSVTLSGGSVGDYLVAGFGLGSGDVTQNNILMTGGSVTGEIYGAYGMGDVKGNTVEFSGGTAGKTVIGGVSGSNGITSDNKIVITGGTITGTAYGGHGSGTGTVSDNSIVIDGANARLLNFVTGGYSHSSGSVEGNSVTLRDGTISQSIFGGESAAGTVSGNWVTMSGGTVGYVYGGGTWGPGAVSGNRVNISGGKVNYNVLGGFSNFTGESSDNVVSVSGGEVNGVIGGESQYSDTRDNRVIISGSAVINWIVYGGNSFSSGDATGNCITILGGSIADNVIGGMSISGQSTGNSVFINGGTTNKGITAGWSGGTGTDATDNHVVISGGNIRGNVEGGFKATLTTGNASYNTITISGSPTFGPNTMVYVASAYSGNATHNTLTISDSPTFGADTGLYGGEVVDNGDKFSDNTLNVWNYSGTSVKSVQNFQFLNFILKTPDTGALTVTNTVDLTEYNGSRTSEVTGVDIMSGGNGLPDGYRIALIRVDSGSFNGTVENIGQTLSGTKGATLNVQFRIEQDSDTLYAVVETSGAVPAAKALVEGFLTGTMFINQGADLVSGPGMAEAVDAASAASAGEDGGYGIGFFATAAGGRFRYESGSHAGASSYSFMAGVSLSRELSPGLLTLGAFVEHGNGSYDTFNSFAGAGTVRGDGDTRYLGGGLLGRMDFRRSDSGRFHAEASLRAGRLRNKYSTSALTDAIGTNANGYESSSGYFGAHAGLGYLWNLSESTVLDLYAKYFWTRQEG
ncbi:MAG: hypothetical protein LBT40_02940, partial [Deltaproteobacteria bacterium]|nr:hypothetical protein [Deltaproteobacteria bacterium]